MNSSIEDCIKTHLNKNTIKEYKVNGWNATCNSLAQFYLILEKSDEDKNAEFVFEINEKNNALLVNNTHRKVVPGKKGYGTPILKELENSFENMKNYLDKKIMIYFNVSKKQTSTIKWLEKNGYNLTTEVHNKISYVKELGNK
jgi:hypothetical protein